VLDRHLPSGLSGLSGPAAGQGGDR
jgi:hypothetical protein